MRFSVIIPHYDSTGELSKKMLNGLLQTLEDQDFDKKEYEVIIVDDLSPYSVEGIEKYTMNLNYLKLEKNEGVALARQVGIEHAKGDYVLFIDNDDNLYSKKTLSKLDLLLDDDTCVLSTGFLEDTNKDNQDGKRIFLPHLNDKTWMHGKVYKRDFLIKNEISFKPHLRYCEDAYFNNLAFSLAWDKAKFSNEITYIWYWNGNSITRRNDKEYNTKYFCDYIKATKTSLNNLKARKDERIDFVVLNIALQSLGYIYYYFQQKEFKSEKIRKSPSYKEAMEQFKAFYTQYEGIYDWINYDTFMEAMCKARLMQTQRQPILERQTFKQFIKSLGLKSHKCFD